MCVPFTNHYYDERCRRTYPKIGFREINQSVKKVDIDTNNSVSNRLKPRLSSCLLGMGILWAHGQGCVRDF